MRGFPFICGQVLIPRIPYQTIPNGWWFRVYKAATVINIIVLMSRFRSSREFVDRATLLSMAPTKCIKTYTKIRIGLAMNLSKQLVYNTGNEVQKMTSKKN